MKIRSVLGLLCGSGLLVLGLAPDVQGGAVHQGPYQWVIPGEYIDCTDEGGTWDIMVSEVILDHATPSGNGHFMWHAMWEGLLTGEDTGSEWYTKGILQVVDRYSLDGDPVGAYLQVENSILKPLTPGAPRILLDVFIQTTFSANGNLVVDKFTYALTCLGKRQ